MAVDLLTEEELSRLGSTFQHLWPVEEVPCFGELIRAIDEADREHWRKCEKDKDLNQRPIFTHS